LVCHSNCLRAQKHYTQSGFDWARHGEAPSPAERRASKTDEPRFSATLFDSILREVALAGAMKKKISAALKKRAAKIKVVLMDVDGTITDGSVTLLSQPDGSALEIKTFDAHDGQGISLARTAGLRMGVITGRESAALRRRMKELNVEFVYEKQAHKIAAYEEVLKMAGVTEDEVAFLGDDLPDLTVMRRVGLAVAVGNAAPEVKQIAHYTTERNGGKGAARELVELILKCKGAWDEMIDQARA
jgi:3-deoxy-D-manno-octulosonate 8-phosphate phosphatase (KDO 8-P phosphatase)